MDLIDSIYANEMQKREQSHSTYIFQMQNKISNDPYVTENAWKYEVYAWLRTLGKKIPDVTEDEIEEKANTISNPDRRTQWLYTRALILSEFYWMPLRIAYDRNSYDWVPDDKFRMMQRYWKVDDAYYKYQIQEQWELDSKGKVKKLEPVKNNDINKVDIDVTDIEREEWKKIVNLLQNKLTEAQTDEEKESIQKDLERAQKRLHDLSSK